jgi:co-chaperonin GroES (HSP10)
MIVPLLHRLIIKLDNPEETTPAGIVIPKAILEREQTGAEIGTVISIGDTAFKDFKAELIPIVGDKVYFAKYAGKKVKDIDEAEYVAINDEDCVAIIK